MRRSSRATRRARGAATAAASAAAILLLLGSVLAACSAFEPSPQACTLIGCESAVLFLVDEDLEAGVTYEVEACLDDRCERGELTVPVRPEQPFTQTADGNLSLDTDEDSVVLLLGEGDYPDSHRAQLTLREQGGEMLAEIDVETELERSQPNGPGCEPICWFAEVSA